MSFESFWIKLDHILNIDYQSIEFSSNYHAVDKKNYPESVKFNLSLQLTYSRFHEHQVSFSMKGHILIFY